MINVFRKPTSGCFFQQRLTISFPTFNSEKTISLNQRPYNQITKLTVLEPTRQTPDDATQK